uniref:Uncharacterized protein n=1 Tax=Myoviridae sp. ctJ2i1 TaxID=2825079 RepID=A0A8S5V204_9CAUD|nr:MAG TPA: hypothetical protein [Myoviridae sp. ctJ2i1]
MGGGRNSYQVMFFVKKWLFLYKQLPSYVFC